MDWTTPQFRHLLRLVTKKTVLYTEMVVDDTVLHAGELDTFVGRFDAGPAVIQIGGSHPETLGSACEILQQYGVSGGHYQEINLNCGCPSSKVSKRCFGAKLMLQPPLVREIVSTMCRRTSCPITVKCRLGVTNERDSYEDLVQFISEAHAGGANKFIIHARDCVLEGLTTKQNSDIPPLRYSEVARLRREFPDLTFVLNGGVPGVAEALRHLGRDEHPSGDEGVGEDVLHPHGVMIGRAVWRNPLILAEADRKVFGCRGSQAITRRQIVEEYGTFCDMLQDKLISDNSGREFHSDLDSVKAAHRKSLTACIGSLFNGVRDNREFMKRMHHTHKGDSVSEYINGALDVFPDHILDEPIGNMGTIPGVD